MTRIKQKPRQIGALPFCIDGSGVLAVYIVTVRGGCRWIIPKGNPIPGLPAHVVAGREAFEEAGLVGRVEPRRFGTFEFSRRRDSGGPGSLVDAYALQVNRQMSRWPEYSERSVLRCSAETAASLVTSPQLRELITRFAESHAAGIIGGFSSKAAG